jgi:hypothetical protein
MNLFPHGCWILIFVILIALFFFSRISADGFVDQASTDANANYAALLLYIQSQPPEKSVKFIRDIKQKFFTDASDVKVPIDYEHLAQLPNGPVF